MGKKQTTKSNNVINPPKSEMERQLRKGADEVWNTEGSLVSTFCELAPEIERFIGKQATYELLLTECLKERFDALSYEELLTLRQANAQFCSDLSTLSNAAVKWALIQGHINAEVSRRENE